MHFFPGECTINLTLIALQSNSTEREQYNLSILSYKFIFRLITPEEVVYLVEFCFEFFDVPLSVRPCVGNGSTTNYLPTDFNPFTILTIQDFCFRDIGFFLVTRTRKKPPTARTFRQRPMQHFQSKLTESRQDDSVRDVSTRGLVP